jgi:hypothetical protein
MADQEHYAVGDRVEVFLDGPFWKSAGWHPGTVIRLDPYSAHRSFIWVELDTSAIDARGGASGVVSILNPKKIRKIKMTGTL